jgi:hypothetical protein
MLKPIGIQLGARQTVRSASNSGQARGPIGSQFGAGETDRSAASSGQARGPDRHPVRGKTDSPIGICLPSKALERAQWSRSGRWLLAAQKSAPDRQQRYPFTSPAIGDRQFIQGSDYPDLCRDLELLDYLRLSLLLKLIPWHWRNIWNPGQNFPKPDIIGLCSILL